MIKSSFKTKIRKEFLKIFNGYLQKIPQPEPYVMVKDYFPINFRNKAKMPLS